MVGDLAEQLRKDVLKNSKMTEEEVDGLMSQLAEQMAESERKLAAERTRQTMVSNSYMYIYSEINWNRNL